MYYKDPNNLDSKMVTGRELRSLIREGFTSETYRKYLRSKPLEPIVNAIIDIDFQAKQLRDYIYRLRNDVLTIKPLGYDYTLSEFLKSKLGRAVALDHHVNRPAYVRVDFGKALNNFFNKKDKEVEDINEDINEEEDKVEKVSRDPNDWGEKHTEYEKEIVEDYGQNRRGTNMKNRYNKIKDRL